MSIPYCVSTSFSKAILLENFGYEVFDTTNIIHGSLVEYTILELYIGDMALAF